MGFNNEQKKSLSNNGYSPSSNDSNKWINGNGHAVTKREGTTIFNTDRHTTNGSGISDTLFNKKAK